MKIFPKTLLASAVFLAGVGGFIWQWQATAGLQTKIAAQRKENYELRRLPGENRRLQEIVTQGNQAEAARQVREEIAKTREEVAMLEFRLRPQAATAVPPADEFSANRDPEKGIVRLEHFRNLGRATPSAAFQTAVWAVTKGQDDALAPLFALSPLGRQKLQAIWDNLPPETRARFDPPEKVLGLFLALDVLDAERLQIIGEDAPSSGQAMLRVRQLKNGRIQPTERKIPFQRGPDGWQFVIPDAMIDGLPEALASASLHIAPPSRGAPSQ